MDPFNQIILKCALSALVLVGAFVSTFLARRAITSHFSHRHLRRHRVAFLFKILNFGISTGALVTLLAVWGLDVANLWLFLSGLLGLIAIGFVAVWSLLSNIVAGLILYLSRPFEIGDRIAVIGDDYGGVVEDIALMSVRLRETGGAVIQVPNNLFYQRAVRVFVEGTNTETEKEGE